MITTERAEALIKRCQIGVGGRKALDDAHEIMAECYGTIGALVAERDRLRAELKIISTWAACGRHEEDFRAIERKAMDCLYPGASEPPCRDAGPTPLRGRVTRRQD